MAKASMKMASEFFGRVPPLFLDLSKILAGEINCSIETLKEYSSDGSPYIINPQAIIYPKNVTDIRHILSFAREYSMPVTVRGGGGGKLAGALGEGIILDMARYFNNIRHISMLDNLVTVDAGVKVSELATRLDGWGFELPPILRSEEVTTIGGLFATRSVSPSTFFHGSIREWVEGLTVVVDNGEEHKIADGITPSGRLLGIYQSVFPILSEQSAQIRAAKPLANEDATGYSIWNTSIGPRQLIDQLSSSEGTLGIITTITFRLIPKRLHSLVTIIPVTEDDLPAIIDVAKNNKTDALFLYDETFQNLSDKYHPGLLPTFIDCPYVLIALHKDTNKNRLHDTVRSFKSELTIPEHLIKSSDDEQKFLRIMSQEFLHQTLATYCKGVLIPIASTEGGIVRVNELPNYIKDATSFVHQSGKITTVTGCVGSGHVAITSLLDQYGKEYADDITSHQEGLFSLLRKYKGGITASGGDGLARTPYLSYCYNEVTLAIFERIKKAWDPMSIFNPGKKIHVSLNYLSQHLHTPKHIAEKP
jgi:FAD/FMN-containing dehydrogenase